MKMPHFQHLVTRPHEIDGLKPQKGPADRPGDARSLTLKIACRECNHGWMAGVADDAMSTLIQMGYGYWGELTADRITALARWAVLFSMSNEYTDIYSVTVSQEGRTRFMNAGEPSAHWHVAVGYGEPFPPRDQTFHRAHELSPNIEWAGYRLGQTTALYFGKLLIVTFYSEYPMPIDFAKFFRSEQMVQIWPMPDMPVRKPLGVHDVDSVKGMVEAISSAINQRRG